MSDVSIVITRVFNAPRELVFDAWIDPEQVARWYGPSAFSNKDVEVDARPGGSFKVVMVSPDGTEGPTGGEFIEVSPHNRIVYRTTTAELSEGFAQMVRGQLEAIGADPERKLESHVTVTFDEHDEGTLLTMTTVFPSEELRQAVGNMGIEAGWNESLDTLERCLAG